jgi:hypothetical protein
MTSLGKRKLSMMPTTRGKYNTMKKLSETYRELGIAFTFPIEIRNKKGKRTYSENSDGFWWCREYDENGDETYYENSDGYWCKWEYDENGNETYFENSDGYWYRREYDEDGKVTYYEDRYGTKRGTKRGSCSGKVIEVDGKKYKLTELCYNDRG